MGRKGAELTGLVVLEVRRTHFDATDIICCSFDFVQFDVPLTSYAQCIVSYFINLLLIVILQSILKSSTTVCSYCNVR